MGNSNTFIYSEVPKSTSSKKKRLSQIEMTTWSKPITNQANVIVKRPKLKFPELFDYEKTKNVSRFV